MREYVAEFLETHPAPEPVECSECGGPLVTANDLRVGAHKYCTDFTTEDYMEDEDWNYDI